MLQAVHVLSMHVFNHADSRLPGPSFMACTHGMPECEVSTFYALHAIASRCIAAMKWLPKHTRASHSNSTSCPVQTCRHTSHASHHVPAVCITHVFVITPPTLARHYVHYTYVALTPPTLARRHMLTTSYTCLSSSLPHWPNSHIMGALC